jgi:hypothetical protein
MICDLFLRTFPGDYKWLPFLFRSMTNHVRGFRDLIVVTPTGAISPRDYVERNLGHGPVKSMARFAECPIYPNDYIGQQVTKLRSWEYSDADEICFLDSDMVFKRAFGPWGLHKEGDEKPIVEVRPWEHVGNAQCYRESTRAILGVDPPFETMARHPFQYSRSMIQRCYDGVGGESRLLAMGAPLSEFNLLGNWAITREGAPPVPVDMAARPDIVRQFWSRGGITAEVEAELRQLGVWEDPA